MAGHSLTQEQQNDPFIQGVLETSGDIPFAVIDPNSFEGLEVDIPEGRFITTEAVTDTHIQQLKDTIDNVAPGMAATLGDDILRQTVADLVNNGPRALWFDYEGERYGMINGFHDSIKSVADVLPQVAHESGIAPTPGSDEEWKHLFGRHEGAHLDDPVPSPNATEDELTLFRLNNEIENDRVALADNDGDISQSVKDALIDYRSLVPGDEFDDFDHANGIFLTPDSTEMASPEHLDAARSVVPKMIEGVAQELDISEAQARAMRIENPEEFIDTVNDLIDKDAFKTDINGNENPYVQEYIENYSDAFQRQVLKRDVSELDQGEVFYDFAALKPVGDGTPQVTQGDVADTMVIGKDTAGNYFAKIADPVLAEQRVEMMAGLDADNTAEQDMALTAAKLG